jgi:hypothetical protein
MKNYFLLFVIFFPSLIFGKIFFDTSDKSTRFNRTIFPAVRAARVPQEKKVYTSEFVQHSHITSGVQYEDASKTNLIDLSMSLGMSKKPLGVKESILCYSPKVMLYKKIHPTVHIPTPFIGAGMGYTGIVDKFKKHEERMVQAGVSLGVCYTTKNKADHTLQLDLFKSVKKQLIIQNSPSELPDQMFEISYGAGF